MIAANSSLEWPLHYAARSWTVFPLDGETKIPYTRQGDHGPERWGATKDSTIIRAHFAPYPNAGIGIPTGVDNGFFVPETDTKGGKNGEAELTKHGELPRTYTVRSPSGSIHRYFKHPGPDFYITSIANHPKLGPGVDIKGDGGMVVAPPTIRGGKRYEIIDDAPIAEAPAWLLAKVARKITDEEKRIVQHAPPTDEPTVEHWEIVKLERWVREALVKNLEWFAVRENALKTTWGIKRGGYGREGYRIADLICSHDEFPETQHVARVSRFWNDRGADRGTTSLNTFWKMCADIGIKGTPEETAEWHAQKEQKKEHMFDGVAVLTLPPGDAPPLATAMSPCPVAAPAPPRLILTSAEFIAGYSPPDYLIDGILQRRYMYSMTAMTGAGKTSIALRWTGHVITGRTMGAREVEQGKVLYFAGENPDDVTARWFVLCREMGIDPATDKVQWVRGAMNMQSVTDRLNKEMAENGNDYALVVVDTSAAYFGGDNENDNTQAGNHARHLRGLTNAPGGPCTLILCHPPKNAGEDMQPRGGGAFIAEMDGNIAVYKKDLLCLAMPYVKFRGDNSWSLHFELDIIRDHPILKDTKGRSTTSVLARPVAETAAAITEARNDMDSISVLRVVCDGPQAGSTPTDIAKALRWTYGKQSEPNRKRVNAKLANLADDKMVKEAMGRWKATSAGQRTINDIEMSKPAAPAPPMFPMPGPPMPPRL